jgi:hypothetical protein
MFLCNTRLSILGMGDTPTLMIKGDVRAFVMGDTPAFVIKGDTPLAMRIFFYFIIGDAH